MGMHGCLEELEGLRLDLCVGVEDPDEIGIALESVFNAVVVARGVAEVVG